jgi:nucleotide-binding universal stress UspA family protein
MEKIKKILAPTDLSDLSQTGMRYALEMASPQGGAEVIVYHVIEYEEANPHDEIFRAESFSSWLLEDRKKFLAELLRDNYGDLISKVKVHQQVEIGVPHQRIVEKAVEEGVDMIVMCTHGRTGILHMLIGSVTERVVRRSPCPVLTIRPAKEEKSASVAA